MGGAAAVHLSVSPADFGHADELIDRAHVQMRRWLTEGRRFGVGHVGSDATVRP